MTPAAMPTIRAPRGSTNPDAGVIATRPATAPEMMPSTLGFLFMTHSANIQASAAVAVAIWVTAIAIPALPLAAVAEPALKPNQPSWGAGGGGGFGTRQPNNKKTICLLAAVAEPALKPNQPTQSSEAPIT